MNPPKYYRGIFFLFSTAIAILQSGYVSFAQTINPDSITIVRDKWGVPHIYAKTDAEAAYGLAWANAEDDFGSIQETLLAVRKKLSEVKGKDGAKMDVLAHLIGLDEAVDNAYDTAFSPPFKKVLDAYVAAVNDYAKKHPEEVLHKKLFPVTSKDVVKGYVFVFTFMTHVHFNFIKILNGLIEPVQNQDSKSAMGYNEEERIEKREEKNFGLAALFKNSPVLDFFSFEKVKDYELNFPEGSNAIAVNKAKTTSGETFIAINSHQPLEGPFAWYEAHLNSEEGLNILGGTFPGGVCIIHGANENLGWAHTLNFPDLSDVYKLQMHPSEKNKYLFDGKWETLRERKIKMKVKIGILKVPVTKTFYWSRYGTTILSKNGNYYSVRFPANMEIRAAEQWYRMNKAKNFSDFSHALNMQAAPGANVVYADREGNIFYLDNGLLPYRNPNYDWEKILPGDTSATLWEQKFYPVDSLPQYKNPDCGYLFNTNNTCFNATCTQNNIACDKINPTMGYLREDNNRSLRLQYLLSQYEKISYEDLKKIKYDVGFMNPLYSFLFANIEDMLNLDETKYPDLTESIRFIKNWDYTAAIDNKPAALITIAFGYLATKMFEQGRIPAVHKNFLEENLLADALRHAQNHLRKNFGTIDVSLGQVQRHVRGNPQKDSTAKNFPVAGAPDVLAAAYTEPYKNGQFKMRVGESYIEMVRYSPGGVKIESVNAYGASAKPSSPHYTDQMEMFVKKQLKPMTLDREKIFREAERIYSPK